MRHTRCAFGTGVKTCALPISLQDCDLFFVALPSSALRSVLAPHAERLSGKLLVSLTKGIEAQTFKLMSEILEEIAPKARIGVISGPNLAREKIGRAPGREGVGRDG